MLVRIALLAITCCSGCATWGNLSAGTDRMAARSEGKKTPQQLGETAESHTREARISAAPSPPGVATGEIAQNSHLSVAYPTELVNQPPPRPARPAPDAEGREFVPVAPAAGSNIVELNLPTALSIVGGQHPAVGLARWQVQEAYARVDQARVLWLPTIQSGFSFHRHDGNYQASDATIVDVNRSSLQFGLGAGATGAGTTPQPGVVAQFHLADAIFQPKITERQAWARGHAASGVLNEQLRDAAAAYLRLLDAYQDARILEESRDRTSELFQLTRDFAEAGEGLRADADRMQTELTLLESRVVASREEVEVASAQLAQAVSLRPGPQIVPLDPTVVPLNMGMADEDTSALISVALTSRPELKQSQALVAAACEAFRRQRYAPFVPSALLGFSTGGFGGGLGNRLDNVDGRYDFDALVLWQVRNLGFGEAAARREAAAQLEQARFEKVLVLDQVAAEVAQAHARVRNRSQQIAITQRAIVSAEASYERNLSRIRDGQGLPIEALQSVQALESARRAYLRAVVDYNVAQFQLQYALGWPVSAPPEMQ